MSLLIEKLEKLAEAAESAGQPRAGMELRGVALAVASALARCAEVRTLRDDFAQAALVSPFVTDCTSAETLAQRAYRVSDAMLQERAK